MSVCTIGSEDPSVIKEAEEWSRRNGWKVIYTNLFDRASVSAGYNWTIQQRERQKNTHRHHDLEYLSMLLNIDYHLKCRAFVCTTHSNFCRLIDELRATVASRANRHYLDLSCGEGACLDENFMISW